MEPSLYNLHRGNMMCTHLHTSSGWFDHIKSTLRGGLITSNPHFHRGYMMCMHLHSSSGWFDHMEPFTGGTWCVGHLHSNSGWLDHIEPLTTPSQGAHDLYALTHQFGVVR